MSINYLLRIIKKAHGSCKKSDLNNDCDKHRRVKFSFYYIFT